MKIHKNFTGQQKSTNSISLYNNRLFIRLILDEIIARTAKQLLRKQFREIESSDSNLYQICTIDFYNKMFESNEISEKWWKEELIPAIHGNFLFF
jgi:hypothetical protein